MTFFYTVDRKYLGINLDGMDQTELAFLQVSQGGDFRRPSPPSPPKNSFQIGLDQ